MRWRSRKIKVARTLLCVGSMCSHVRAIECDWQWNLENCSDTRFIINFRQKMRLAWESKQRELLPLRWRKQAKAIDRNGSAEKKKKKKQYTISRRQQQYSSRRRHRRKPQNERNTYLLPLFALHYYHRLPYHRRKKNNNRIPERQISPSHAMKHWIFGASKAVRAVRAV